jgi:hypothetical protein
MTLSLIPPSSDDPEQPGQAAALRRIALAIGSLHAEAKPSPDWQERVLASLPTDAAGAAVPAAPAASSSPRRWLRYAPLCAAAALLMIWAPWQPRAAARTLVVELDATTVVTRGEAPRPGSRVKVAAVSGAAHRALWIFRDRAELVMACDEAAVAASSQAARCLRSDDRLSTALEIALVGEYVVVALWSDAPIPLPSSSRDESLAAARRAGATAQSQSFRVW